MTSEKSYSTEQRLNALIAAGGISFTVRKPGGTARSSQTLTDDPDLQIPLLGGVIYAFTCWLYFDGSHAPGDLVVMLVTGDNAGAFQCNHNEGGATGFTNSDHLYNIGDGTSFACGSGTADGRTASYVGVVTPASDTTLVLRWARSTSSSTATTLHGSSWLQVTPIQ